jgi:voltage-gated potassium channel
MGDMVVVDRSNENVNRALRIGAVGVQGDSTREPILEQAGIDKADTIIVCVDRDDTAVLVTLTARRLAPEATIVTSVRESQNAEVLKQSGANTVIPTAESAGRMLGLSSTAPRAGELLEDLLGPGEGLEFRERLVLPNEIGRTCQEVVLGGQIAIAVVRGGTTLRWDNADIGPLRQDDGLVVIHNCDQD